MMTDDWEREWRRKIENGTKEADWERDDKGKSRIKWRKQIKNEMSEANQNGMVETGVEWNGGVGSTWNDIASLEGNKNYGFKMETRSSMSENKRQQEIYFEN